MTRTAKLLEVGRRGHRSWPRLLPPTQDDGVCLLATFDSQAALLEAIEALKSAGCAVREVFSPFPIPELDVHLGVRRSRLGIVTGAAAAVAATAAFGFQYWASVVSWPLNVGGKPDNSALAFIPITFELTILAAGLATAAAFLLRSRLHPGRRPKIELPRATDDRFVLMLPVAAPLPKPELERLLVGSGALQVSEWSGKR